ncbi:MAG: fructose-bisphosphate aldolase class II [Alphaproteobacteria bacterium]|nr:fructose-bisphosphate aldolase class II [Alphaproteobacteria bacterium]
MPIVSMRQILDHAAENNYGVPAFNFNDMEQILAVLNAARKVNAPVILQTSTGARKFSGDPMIRHMFQAVLEMYPELPICLHQDHGASVDICQSAIVNGYSSVMMDGSLQADGKTPASFEYNANVTKEVVKRAHAVGASVEGELGVIGSLETGMGDKEDGHGAEGKIDKKKLVTDPEEAVRFVAETGVDALAVAVGTSHGAYKFTRPPTGDILAIDVIEQIHKKLPNTHLVMHGSSSVPKELVDIINSFGGAIPETYGVPVAEIVRGIKSGVRKVNVDTDLRLALTGAIRQVFAKDPKEFDPRKFMKPAMDAVQKECEARYIDFGAAGQASKIKVIGLPEMAKRYAAGEL